MVIGLSMIIQNIREVNFSLVSLKVRKCEYSVLARFFLFVQFVQPTVLNSNPFTAMIFLYNLG